MMDYRKDKIARRAFDEKSGTTVKFSDSRQKQTQANMSREEEIRAWARHTVARNGFADVA